MGENLKVIGEHSFQYAYNLQRVVMNGVTEIKDTAFGNCTKLAYVTCTDSLKVIENNAFENCNVLTIVYYKGTINDWLKLDFSSGNQKFKDVPTVNFI